MAGHGYYSQLEDPPAPYLRVQVRFPTLGIEGELDFLVDSGADTTALLPDDMDKLGISAGRWVPLRWGTNGEVEAVSQRYLFPPHTRASWNA